MGKAASPRLALSPRLAGDVGAQVAAAVEAAREKADALDELAQTA